MLEEMQQSDRFTKMFESPHISADEDANSAALSNPDLEEPAADEDANFEALSDHDLEEPEADEDANSAA